jgi:hypothetical protein
VGAAPPGHRTLHCWTWVHVTWHSPAQSTSQVFTLVQVMALAPPAATAHVVASWQSNVQPAPQRTLAVLTLKERMLQSLWHDDVHVFMSWHV